MQMLYCIICGTPTEAHDYADAVICDTCPVPVVEEINERQSEKDAVQSSHPNDTIQSS